MATLTENNMAADFLRVWRECALGDSTEYAQSSAFRAVLEALVTARSFERLDLRGSRKELNRARLRDLDLMVLLKAVMSYGKVSVLDVSYNTITDNGLDSLAEYLKDPNCSISELNLSHNDFTGPGTEILSTALQFNSSLKHLDISGCKVGPNGGIHIASMLQVNRSLEHLNLAGTDMDTDCIIAMATVLHGNQTLRSIDLSRPLLRSKLEESTIHISRMLQTNTTLQELHLSKHSVSDTGAGWLCRHLRDNNTLTHLDLSSNTLSRDGGKLLAGVLQTNTCLTVLNVNCNHIEDDGLTAISEALESNSSLTSLNVCYNHIGDKGLCGLARALKQNSTLSCIFYWGNQIGQPTCNAFSDLLKTCRLSPQCTDVLFYTVDGTMLPARTDHHAF